VPFSRVRFLGWIGQVREFRHRRAVLAEEAGHGAATTPAGIAGSGMGNKGAQRDF